MASPYVYKSNGASSGARLATRSPVYVSGRVWYVDYTNGVDAAGTRGLERARPLKTLAQAVTNGSAGDKIQFLPNHAETLAASQVLSKAGMHLRSEGTGTARARFTCSGAVDMFDITARGVWIESIVFPKSTAVATARVRVGALGFQAYNCEWDCGESDTNPALKFITGAGQAAVRSCQFDSVSTSVTTQPAIGLEVANAINDLYLDGVIFDGGTVAWSDFALKCTAAVTGLVGIDVDLLNGSDVYTATGSVYEFHVRNQSGSSRLEFTA